MNRFLTKLIGAALLCDGQLYNFPDENSPWVPGQIGGHYIFGDGLTLLLLECAAARAVHRLE
jgi:hypothetical protein